MTLPPAMSRFLTATLGFAEDAVGQGAITRALAAAMRQEGLDDVMAYSQAFTTSQEIRQRLIDEIVVGETWFFRDREPFVFLADKAKGLLDAQPGGILNILSAPCSTGEEPYSIVMTLLDAGLPPSSFTVHGVDISLRALKSAQKACYGKGSFRSPLEGGRTLFFQDTRQGRQLTDLVVRQVSFHHDNLVDPACLAGHEPYGVVFCRNLLIYLSTDARQRFFRRLNALLLPGGLLFAGHTETVFWQQQGYVPLPWDRAFALTKPVDATLPRMQPKGGKTSEPSTRPDQPVANQRPLRRPRTGGRSIPPIDLPIGERSVPSVGREGGRSTALVPASGDTEETFQAPDLLQEARRLADRGYLAEAMRLCRIHERSAGPGAETYSLMGVILTAKGDAKQAEASFLKALYLDPDHYESLVHASLIFRRKGDEQRADLYRKRADRQLEKGNLTRETAP